MIPQGCVKIVCSILSPKTNVNVVLMSSPLSPSPSPGTHSVYESSSKFIQFLFLISHNTDTLAIVSPGRRESTNFFFSPFFLFPWFFLFPFQTNHPRNHPRYARIRTSHVHHALRYRISRRQHLIRFNFVSTKCLSLTTLNRRESSSR